MDWTELKEHLPQLLKKYAPALLVLAAGMLILLLPEKNRTQTPRETEAIPETQTLQQELETVLSAVEGAGKVKVLLTVSTGQQTLFQVDGQERESEIRRDTVIITGSDRAETGLVKRVDSETYRGAVVICQGADSASVRLALTEAVMTATGLTADKISILKMK